MRRIAAAVVLAAGIAFGAASASAGPGHLDPSFGQAGKVVTDFGSGDEKVFALLPRGAKLFAAGYEGNPTSGSLDFGIARYLGDGKLDASWGSAGSGNLRIGFGHGTADTAYEVADAPGHRLVVVGISGDRFAATRLLPTGQLDSSFSGDGRVTTAFPQAKKAWAFAARVQPDGKVVAAGTKTDGSGANQDFALVRYLSNGSLDSGFGLGGRVVTSFGSDNDAALALLRQPDGKLVAAGTSGSDFSSKGDFALARYLSNGTLDPSFGTAGKVTTSFGVRAGIADAALQPDGKIVAVGSAAGKLALARYTASGSLDTSFGSGGKVTTWLGENADLNGAAIDASGRIVVAGTLYSAAQAPRFFVVARYTTVGKLDTSFTLSGVVRTSFGAGMAAGQAVALQGGKIVVGGYSATQGWATDFALARFGTKVAP